MEWSREPAKVEQGLRAPSHRDRGAAWPEGLESWLRELGFTKNKYRWTLMFF